MGSHLESGESNTSKQSSLPEGNIKIPPISDELVESLRQAGVSITDIHISKPALVECLYCLFSPDGHRDHDLSVDIAQICLTNVPNLQMLSRVWWKKNPSATPETIRELKERHGIDFIDHSKDPDVPLPKQSDKELPFIMLTTPQEAIINSTIEYCLEKMQISPETIQVDYQTARRLDFHEDQLVINFNTTDLIQKLIRQEYFDIFKPLSSGRLQIAILRRLRELTAKAK